MSNVAIFKIRGLLPTGVWADVYMAPLGKLLEDLAPEDRDQIEADVTSYCEVLTDTYSNGKDATCAMKFKQSSDCMFKTIAINAAAFAALEFIVVDPTDHV